MEQQETRQNAFYPSRTVGSDISVEFRPKCHFVPGKYKLLDEAVASADLFSPVLFDEQCHLTGPFETPLQKLRFFSDHQLCMPVDLYKYCPGGA